MVSKLTALCFGLALIGLTGCKSKMDIAATVSQLVGSSWTLGELNGSKLNPANYEMKGLPTLSFESADQVVGNTGCNGFSSKMKATAESVKFMPGPMTKMFCEGVDENGFMDAINAANNIQLDGDNLVLLNGEKAVMKFNKQ